MFQMQPKFINYRTIIIKPANKGVAVAVLSTTHYKAMTIQDLDDANTYKKLKQRHENTQKLEKAFTQMQ